MNLKRIVRSIIKCISTISDIVYTISVGVVGVLIALGILGVHMIMSALFLELMGWWGFGVHATVVVAIIIGFVLIRDVLEVGWWISMAMLSAIWPICLVLGAVASLSMVSSKGWSRLCTWCEYES
jgi:hypothetical protein